MTTDDIMALADSLDAIHFRRLHAENEAMRADAERYRWLRNESWAGYNISKGVPGVYTVDGAGNLRMMLAEEAMDDAIDAARGAK